MNATPQEELEARIENELAEVQKNQRTIRGHTQHFLRAFSGGVPNSKMQAIERATTTRLTLAEAAAETTEAAALTALADSQKILALRRAVVNERRQG